MNQFIYELIQFIGVSMAGLREQRKREREQQIFTAALQLINEKGLRETHMTEIAARAGLAVGTLYNYFPSKNDLMVTIMECEWEAIVSRHRRHLVRTVMHGREPLEILRSIVRPIMEELFIIPKQSWSDLLIAMFGSRQYLERGYELDMEAVAGLTGLLRKMQQRNLLRRDIPAESCAYSLYSLITFQFLAYLFYPQMERESLLAGMEEQLTVLVEGIGAEGSGHLPQAAPKGSPAQVFEALQRRKQK
jgi:AcrR family transcriptional regulator